MYKHHPQQPVVLRLNVSSGTKPRQQQQTKKQGSDSHQPCTLC